MDAQGFFGRGLAKTFIGTEVDLLKIKGVGFNTVRIRGLSGRPASPARTSITLRISICC